MTKKDIITKVKALKLPKDSYIVFGSCPLAILGIREVNDIDLLVSPGIYKKLKTDGWQKVYKGPNDTPLTSGIFEAHDNWNFSSQYNPTLKNLLSTALVVEDTPFASLDEVRKWKVSSGRPKDLADIKLIDHYLKK